MENGIVKKALKLGARGLLHTLGFSLSVIADALASSAKEEEHKPSTEELICGERIIGSDKYYFPNKKAHK